MWEPQPLTTLRASKACRGENFTLYYVFAYSLHKEPFVLNLMQFSSIFKENIICVGFLCTKIKYDQRRFWTERQWPIPSKFVKWSEDETDYHIWPLFYTPILCISYKEHKITGINNKENIIKELKQCNLRKTED
jgi:hypothetical protein